MGGYNIFGWGNEQQKNTAKRSTCEKSKRWEQDRQTTSLETDVITLCFSLDSNMDGRGAAPREDYS